ncbi:TolC family protein [bacterium]|nr:TolC family protein [bacterium]
MKRIRIFIWTAALFSTVRAEVTLEMCLEAALRHNPRLRAAESDAEASRELYAQASASRLPSLDFSGTYRRQSMTPEILTDPILLSPQGPAIRPFGDGLRLGSMDNTDFKVTLTQPLFSGFRLRHAVKSAWANAEAGKMEAEEMRQNLAFQVRSAYGGLLKARSSLSIAKSSQERIGEHLKDVRAFFIQGLCRKDDLLGTEVKWDESELWILQAQNGIRLACSTLEHLTGMSLDDSVLADPPADEFFHEDLESSIRKALMQRPEIAAMKWTRQAAEYGKRIAGGAVFPVVAVFGSLGYGRPGLDLIHDRWMDYWILGAGVEWKLWDWGKRKSTVREAQYRINGLAERQKQLRDGIVLDVTQAFSRCEEARQRMQTTARMTERAGESFRIVENRYRQGQATHTEYFDAHSDYIRSQLLQSQAAIDAFLEKSNWERAMGNKIIDQQELP